MSRNTAVWLAIGLAAALVLFAVVSILTGEPGWILWSVVPLLGVLGFVLAGVRGQTLGEQKRQRDVVIAERKAAERKTTTTARAPRN